MIFAWLEHARRVSKTSIGYFVSPRRVLEADLAAGRAVRVPRQRLDGMILFVLFGALPVSVS